METLEPLLQSSELNPIPENGPPAEDGLRELKEEIVYGPPSSDLLSSFNETTHCKQRPSRRLNKLHTAPAITSSYTNHGPEASAESKPPGLASSSGIVKRLVIGVLLYISAGAIFYYFAAKQFKGTTTKPLVDALYFTIVTISTTGYGDITPNSTLTKLCFCAFVLLGFGVSDILISGITTYILERHEVLFISAVRSSDRLGSAREYLVNTEQGRMTNCMKISLALLVVFCSLAFGTISVKFLEGLGWMDSFYLVCMSVTTVGYGDLSFTSVGGRAFASVWLLVSSVAVTRAYIFLAELRIRNRNRAFARWVLEKGMTPEDLVAADIDNNGKLSKSEFVMFKLKQLGRISKDDIDEVCVQFQALDVDNSGRITLSCLSNA